MNCLAGDSLHIEGLAMDYQPPREWQRHYASTGHDCLDSIGFSAPPSAVVHDTPHRNLTVFENTPSGRPARSDAVHSQIDVLVETRDLINLSLVGGGQCWLLEGRSTIHYPVRRDSIAFVPAGFRRLIDVAGPVDTLTVSMPKGLLGRMDEEKGECSAEPFGNLHDPRMAQLVRMLAGEISRPGFAADVLIDGLLRAINGLIMKRSIVADPYPIDRIHIAPLRLSRVMEHIEANVARPITLSELAVIAGLSVFHFSRVFKRQTGTTPYQAVTAKRLELSRRLIAAGDIPLAEIALVCGFSSQAHFTTAFSKHMGMSPGRYRRSVMH